MPSCQQISAATPMPQQRPSREFEAAQLRAEEMSVMFSNTCIYTCFGDSFHYQLNHFNHCGRAHFTPHCFNTTLLGCGTNKTLPTVYGDLVYIVNRPWSGCGLELRTT